MEERSAHRISQLLSSLALPHYQRVGGARQEDLQGPLEGVEEGKMSCLECLKCLLNIVALLYFNTDRLINSNDKHPFITCTHMKNTN